jgi:chromosomal replication initiation ATPase DnaA
MNQETTTNISQVFKELEKTINVIGAKRLIEILTYSRKNNILLTSQQVLEAEKIISIVCDEFKISVEELYSAKRKNNRRNAVGVCALFLQNNVGLDNANIAYILKKPDALVSVYKNEIVSLKASHPMDKLTIIKLENITNKLNTLKDEQ